MRLWTKIAILVAVSIGMWCCGSRDLELSSRGPVPGREVRVYLQSSFFDARNRLQIEILGGRGSRRFGPSDIEKAGVDAADTHEFEWGACLTESAWPTSDIVVVLVKNCLGSVTIVAYDYSSGRLMSADRFLDSMRDAIRASYRSVMKDPEQDPLVWVNSREANIEYKVSRGYDRKEAERVDPH